MEKEWRPGTTQKIDSSSDSSGVSAFDSDRDSGFNRDKSDGASGASDPSSTIGG